jgi:opacity protein-like surface antigen
MNSQSLISNIALFSLITLTGAHSTAHAVESSFFLKSGAIFLDRTSQTLDDNTTRSFDSSSHNTYAWAWEVRFPIGREKLHHIAPGLEYVRYYYSFTPRTGGSEADASVSMFVVKYYAMLPDSPFHPFAGFGYGYGRTRVSTNSFGFDDTILDNSLALQISAGVEYRPKDFGVYAELKYVDNYSQNRTSRDFNASGWGIFVGLAVRFVGR